jgi:hypothetical protein
LIWALMKTKSVAEVAADPLVVKDVDRRALKSVV